MALIKHRPHHSVGQRLTEPQFTPTFPLALVPFHALRRPVSTANRCGIEASLSRPLKRCPT